MNIKLKPDRKACAVQKTNEIMGALKILWASFFLVLIAPLLWWVVTGDELWLAHEVSAVGMITVVFTLVWNRP